MNPMLSSSHHIFIVNFAPSAARLTLMQFHVTTLVQSLPSRIRVPMPCIMKNLAGLVVLLRLADI
jgi:hypothetical protein